jgi:crotonobetainyl-CoA:carnitine CoA-transferase CaiB-like acyl-CoA transferase
MANGILSGLRVLDFTWVLAGPYATRLLADFGAEVIKVQSKKTAKGAESNTTGYFNTWNRNKRSITLDLNDPEAKNLVLKLTEISDVVIENFTPRVMSNWQLDYEKLRQVKPNLIMISMSAMGQTGPWRDVVAFGPALQALSSFTYLTSFEPNSPIGIGYAYADPIAGLYAALAILAALEHRDRTGQGLFIDLSEYEAICTLIGPTLLDALVNPKTILPQGNQSSYLNAAPCGCYKCSGKERWCVIAVSNEKEWQSLCERMGAPDWTKEEKFSTLSQRITHREELDKFIGEWTAQHTPEEIVALLQEAGVPAGVVQNAEDLANDPHLMARDFFVKLKHPVLGETISDAPPIRLHGSPTTGWKAAPLLGEDNRYVFREILGLKEDEFSSLIKKGVIG